MLSSFKGMEEDYQQQKMIFSLNPSELCGTPSCRAVPGANHRILTCMFRKKSNETLKIIMMGILTRRHHYVALRMDATIA